MTVGALFASAARDYPQRTFLRWCRGDDRITWTYAEAALRVEALAARLDALGIAAGDHVVVYTAEMVPSILFDLACACRGIVFTPIETSSLPAVLELCARVGAKAVLTTPGRSVEGVPVVTEDGRGACAGDPAAAVRRLAETTQRLDGDSVYMLQPTSGTTGGSKLVIRSHAAFVRTAELHTYGHRRETEPAARVLMVPALTHGMGQYLLATGVLLAGELGVTTRIDVDASIDEIRWLDPTHLALTPRVVRSLIKQLGGATDRIFGPGARFCLCGGAAPDPDLLAAIARTGVSVIEAYGASEISVVAMTRPGQWRAGVVGPVLGDCELRVSDDGELEARTPVMMRGYYNAPELTAAAFTADGYYRTGDRVAIEGGELRYLGRVVDTFNLFDGSHVAPGPIEDAVTRQPWVAQVVLLGDQRPYVTGVIVAHPALRASPSLRRMIERDLGRIGAASDVNARIRRVAVLDGPLPDEVHQVVGHGKVRRTRAAVATRFPELVAALYGGPVPAGATVIDVPGAAAERRGSSRQPVAWLVQLDGAAVARTRDASRGGAFVELADPIAPARLEVIELDGRTIALDVEVVRREPDGVAVRWLGPPAALAQLAARLRP